LVRARISGAYSAAGLSRETTCELEGRVDGICALAAELGDGADDDVLAQAFTRLGDGLLTRIGGTFALLVWSDATREGLLATDPLGSRSLFFCETGGSLLFATELRDLLDRLPSAAPPSEASVARWLAYGALNPDETLYEGIRRLPGGCCLLLREGCWEQRRYWTPRYKGVDRVGLEEAAEEVLAGVRAGVARRCEGRRAAVLLSGGLDSGAVAATAREHAASLRAYSAVFPGDPDADEARLVELATTALRIPSTTQPNAADGVLRASAEHVGEWHVPAASPNLFFQTGLLARARDDGAEVVLDGQGGDELFGASPFLLADRVRRGRRREARRLALDLAGGDEELARRLYRRYGVRGAAPAALVTLRRRLRRGAPHHWLTSHAAAAARTQPGSNTRLDGPRWWADQADRLTRGRERAGVHDHLRRKLSGAGLEGGHPLLDDLSLVELVLRLPPELAFDPELDRPLLRRALRGLLPDEIRLRATKSYFDSLVVKSLSGPERPQLTSLLGWPRAEIRRYVTEARLRDIVDGPTAQERPFDWAWNSWRVASTELWLRSL
jgi:asparagine synthase (glutamine-hydrolysing)